MERKSFITGIILIGLGVLFLADNFDWISFRWANLWPFLLIIGGILFWLAWFGNRREYGLLMPGTILIVYGLLFWYCTAYGWWHMGEDNLWAFFMIGPGLGFVFMYLLGNKERGLLVPAGILIGIGSIFLSGPHNLRLVWPLALIAIGVYLLFKHRREQSGDKPKPASPPPPADAQSNG